MYNDIGTAFLIFILMVVCLSLTALVFKKKETKKLIFSGAESIGTRQLLLVFKIGSGILFGLGSVFLLLALARPQEKQLEPKTSEKGVDIIFSLDISDSMLIEDMAPHANRLESAKFQ